MSKKFADLLLNKRCFGIAGCTSSGKTTLAKTLANELGSSTVVVSQDEFYKPKEEIDRVQSRLNPNITFYDYDSKNSMDEMKMAERIQHLLADPNIQIVLVEGNMITELPLIFEKLEHVVFLTLAEKRCREIRAPRIYEPPDEKGQFEEIVWPAYQRTLANIQTMIKQLKTPEERNKVVLVDVTHQFMSTKELILYFRHLANDYLNIQADPLNLTELLTFVNGNPACGAQSIFIGTTRDTFDGRRVLRLDYEAYDAMAYEEMRRLCLEVRRRCPDIYRVVISHRTGIVPIKDASVFIATSSPHRRQAFEATSWLIDELKRTVPIWKREVYDDGDSSWKQNAESIVVSPTKNHEVTSP